MLKEKEALGKAIIEAIEMNGYSKADAARKFNVKPPSITGWIQTGRISKSNFEELRKWLTRTPPEHWYSNSCTTQGKLQVNGLTPGEQELLEVFRSLPDDYERSVAIKTMRLRCAWDGIKK